MKLGSIVLFSRFLLFVRSPARIMEASLLVSDTQPRRLVIRPLSTSNKKSSYILLLEHLQSQSGNAGHSAQLPRSPSALNGNNANASANISRCTARFQPAGSFDVSDFRPLYDGLIYGCLGLIHVDQGALAVNMYSANSRALSLRRYRMRVRG